MADETKPDAEEAAPPKKSKKMLFIILFAVVAAGGGGAAFFMTKGDAAPPPGGQVAEVAAPVEEKAGLIPLDSFLVNLADERGERYMKVTMRLTVAPESVADEIKEQDLELARIRDRVLTVLMSKTFEEMVNPLGKESLRLEIQAQTDSLIESGEVRDVLFSEFVVQ